MRRALLPPLLVLGLAFPLPAAPAAACEVAADLIADQPRFNALAKRFQNKAPVTIVAIGGASTAGAAAGAGPELAYPNRLEEALKRRHPDRAITVVNEGVPRQTTQEMVDRFAKAIYPRQPALVIWEAGTVDAARSANVEEFAQSLLSGIDELRERAIEVMLVDMQYNRGAASVINYQPYLDAMHHAADVEEVYLFRRFDIMKYWSDTGVFDFADVPKDKRASLAGEVYRCLGERLAEAIDLATQ